MGLIAAPVGRMSRDRNAAWLGIEWVNEPVVETAIQALAADLQRHRITYIGVPTSEEETYLHHPRAEDITSGIGGVLCALKFCRSCTTTVTGLAVYPYWETDAQEWGVFRRMWLLERSHSGPEAKPSEALLCSSRRKHCQCPA